MANFKPVIKWSGSKRSQCDEIINQFPKHIDTYYEPFLGGGSVMRRLMERDDVAVENYVCSDLNRDLINLWNGIKNDPSDISTRYEEMWGEMNSLSDQRKKADYFNEVRDRLNATHDHRDFMFIMRTCTNGMPRYNKNGDFNNSFHITRNGIEPQTLRNIIFDWSVKLNQKDVKFLHRSFEDVVANEEDYVYMDPPYMNTKGMYFSSFDSGKLFDFMRSLKCKYSFSYNGKSGQDDNTADVPEDVYTEHLYLKSGNSSFKRTIGKDRHAMVFESLYIKK